MTTHTETRKVRTNLTPEQKAQAEKIGSLSFQSHRNPFKYRAHETHKFIPSREQH